ncbi:hypothetical protein B0H17DRAFT_715346 [Mycena rosella]|uniref:Uncharacterized protein n=1 Tax=Mycena rosella TaxID=1033263 RepID=A0AAD7DAB4_MYCRO|nr:hypothetical protein B0H17DRAFT_715346 [Mycena rosella]
MRALPDPSTSRPGDEIAAQIRRDERARFVHEASPWPYRPTPPRESHREATAPPLNRHSRAERPSLPIPRSGPSTSPRRDWGENLVSTSPEDAEPPSQWPYPTSQQYPPAPNTHPWSPPAAPRQTPVPAPPVVRSNNSRPQPREDAAVSSSSDSEDEEMEPAPRRRGPQNDWNSGAERS